MEQIKDDLIIMNVDDSQEITKKFITAKYKKLAKERHPDREGSTNVAFQELQNAYWRIIKFLEEKEMKEESEDVVVDFETEFFKAHNIVKECTSSFVIYIQDHLADRWRKVLERHITVHSPDKGRVIFRAGKITVTLYIKPKKDPRSKIHIQSGNQNMNLEFILDCLLLFYREVCCMAVNTDLEDKAVQKSVCGKCGKQFVNKKGLKQHVQRMHSSKREKRLPVKSTPIVDEIMNAATCQNSKTISDDVNVTLEETVLDINAQQSVIRENIGKDVNPAASLDTNSDLEMFMLTLINDLIPSEKPTAGHDRGEEEIGMNYQCGVCGKLFQSEDHVNTHMSDHEENDPTSSSDNSRKESLLEKILAENVLEINEIKLKNHNLVSKNEALSKENKRLKLAIIESEHKKRMK